MKVVEPDAGGLDFRFEVIVDDERSVCLHGCWFPRLIVHIICGLYRQPITKIGITSSFAIVALLHHVPIQLHIAPVIAPEGNL